MPSRNWLEIDLERIGAEVQAKALGSRGEHALPHVLGPALDVNLLSQFTQQVREAAARARPLGMHLKQAQMLHQALFRGEVQEVMLRLREAAGGEQLLLRLMLHRDGTLQEFPWEALCEPDTTLGFMGSSPDMLLTRGVSSKEPLQPREVRGAVRVLAIAPSDEEALTVLRVALEESIVAGEIQWLEPLVGTGARLPYLFDRLQREPIPHIIHFIGHGCVDPKGAPLLRLADEDGEETWLEVELLAQQFKEGFRKYLRLIVLDACEGARPGALASAAEWLTRSGADAVVAHLWPVKADIARACSRAFYQSLTGTAQQRGDVACSLNHARRTVLGSFGGSAEAFSPVLYLRGHDSILFDFKSRKLLPPSSPSTHSDHAATDTQAPALHRLLEQPFTLVLGDRWKDERVMLDGFRERLRQTLTRKVGSLPAELSMSTLTQHYALHFGEKDLDEVFQDAFGDAAAALPLIGALARKLRPGFHVTLLRLPLLELALAEEQPERTLYVIQPSGAADGGRATVRKREGGGKSWEKLRELPESFDLSKELVVLRHYCGYLPPHVFMRPLLTEDDYLLGINELEAMLPLELADSLMGELNIRPVLLLGLSMLTWHHRMLLYRLFGKRPLPSGSLVILEPGEKERELWERGRILPARAGVQVLELSASELTVPFDTWAVAERP
ncbi:CHAT domain-containing protein [Archangium lansingense]|uniref:CHAT domain-containing protein n=1 Tax=Archangium lansingense TaxID=2995310 RepID=UPI003B76D7DB